MRIPKGALSFVIFALKMRWIRGTVARLSDKDKQNIERILDENEIPVTDKRGNV